jgi:hypothetical protein
MKKFGKSAKAANTKLMASAFVSLFLVSIYVGCGQAFLGRNGKKPSTAKPPKTESISPNESEVPRSDLPDTNTDNSIVASGEGTVSGTPAPSNTISLSVIQSDSESWWKNCLYAKTKQSPTWVPVSCNKKSAGFPANGTVTLPAKENECNTLQIKMESFRNQGEACNERKLKGLSCEGPYSPSPDATRMPASNSQNNFRLYDSKGIANPETLILSNATWNLPDFKKLQSEMNAFRGDSKKNQWIRAFFEDKSEATIADAKAAINGGPSGAAHAKSLGVDFNDYVFDIKSVNVKFTVEGSGMGCEL